MKKEEMRNFIKIKDIFKILSEEASYRETVKVLSKDIQEEGTDIKEEGTDIKEVIKGFKRLKREKAMKHRKVLKEWISSKDSLGLAEGLVERVGITDSEEQEGKAGNYLVIWYVLTKGGLGLIAEHRNTKEEVREQLYRDLEELCIEMMEHIYVIDVENKRVLDFVICMDKVDGGLAVRFVEDK